MPDPQFSIYNWAEAVLAAGQSRLASTSNPLPSAIFVDRGVTPPVDHVCSGGTGQLTVNVVRLFRTTDFPEETMTPPIGGTVQVAGEFVMQLWRCDTGTLTDSGVPVPETVTGAAQTVLVDLWALEQAGLDVANGNDDGGLVTNAGPLPSDGGAMGCSVSVMLNLGDGCWGR